MYINLNQIFLILIKNINISEKRILRLLLTITSYCFTETVPVEEPRRTISQIPATSTPWLFLSFCGATVITKPESCNYLMDYSEYVTWIQHDGDWAVKEDFYLRCKNYIYAWNTELRFKSATGLNKPYYYEAAKRVLFVWDLKKSSEILEYLFSELIWSSWFIVNGK
jgi:hypothetical protein